MFSRVSGSVPLLVSEWLDDTLIAQEVENRIGQFTQQPPIRIRDSVYGRLACLPLGGLPLASALSAVIIGRIKGLGYEN